MPIKRTTKEDLKRILDGMLYHCMDLTSFMAEHNHDPYFETEQGKRMMKYVVDICAKHALACMEFMIGDLNKDDKEGSKNPSDIEQMLKDML